MVHTAELQSVIDRPWSALVPGFFQRYPNPYASHVVQVDIIDRQLVPASAPRAQWPPRTGASATSEPGDGDGDADDHLVLRTSRLILKRGTLPSWAPRGVIKSTESWVLEETEVDMEPPPAPLLAPAEVPAAPQGPSAPTLSTLAPLPPRRMKVWTRNLDHTNVLAVTEGLTLIERPSSATAAAVPPVAGATRATSSAGAGAGAGAGAEGEGAGASDAGDAEPRTDLLTRGHVASSLAFGLLRGRVEKFGLKRFRAHADTSRAGLAWAADGVLGRKPARRMAPAPVPSPESLGGGRVATAVRRFLWRFRRPVPDPPDVEAEQDADKWRTKLRAALRPPFLDGYPPTPLQRARNWIWGDQGRVAQAREAEERIRWAYKARQLLGVGPSQPWAPQSREGGRGYSPLWARLRRMPRPEEVTGEDSAPSQTNVQ